jgi:hypothetical protein
MYLYPYNQKTGPGRKYKAMLQSRLHLVISVLSLSNAMQELRMQTPCPVADVVDEIIFQPHAHTYPLVLGHKSL